MKRVALIVTAMLCVTMVFADGEKGLLKKSLAYNPNPQSADIGSALNIYTGPGTVRGSNLGFSIGGDFEFPVIDPNLTLGPGIGFGIHHYPVGFWKNGVYHTGTTQFSMYGGVVARYYADWLIPSMPDDFDVFITSNMGFGMINYVEFFDSKFFFDFGSAVGGRWNFSSNMSLYAQGGFGTSNLLVGISFKL